jgi:hypothetical protein
MMNRRQLCLASALYATTWPVSATDMAAQTLLSEKGALRLRLERRAPMKVGNYVTWHIWITQLDSQPADVSLAVRGGMPAHGHGLPSTPEVRRLSVGEFLVEGLMFNMPGAWVITFDLVTKASRDLATLRFDLLP